MLDTRSLGRDVNEALVLSVLRDGARHGYQIALDVEDRSGGVFELQHGTLYPILHRLEGEGHIKGSWDRSSGRRRKVYALTRGGRAHLESEGAQVLSAFEALRAVLGGDS